MTLLWSWLELRQVSTYSSSKRILALQWLRQLLSRSSYSFILVMQQSFSRLNSFLSQSNMPCRLSSLDLFVFSFAQASSACQSSSMCDRYYFSRFQYSSMRWSLLVSDRQCSSMASQSNLILLVISSITSSFRASILFSLPFSCCSSWTFAYNSCQALLGLALSFLCLMLECGFCRWCQRQGEMYLLTGDLELDLLCQSGDLERGGYFVGVGFSLMDLKQCSVLMRLALLGDLDFCFFGSAMLMEGMEEIMKLLLVLGYCGNTVALSSQLVLILSFLAFEPCTRQTVQPSPQMKSAICSF